MTCFKFLHFGLLFLLRQVFSQEPEPTFRPGGSVVELGYCFGVDYIVVYRVAPEGDQLLGNSSAANPAITPPADLQGRISTSHHQHLLGLQVRNLTHHDSGIYRRECWQNHTIVNNYTQKLLVCDLEIEAEEIIVSEVDGRAEILCNSTFIGKEGTTVRWYYEIHPSYKTIVFLDSSVSLDPFVEGVLEVKNGGASLVLDKSMLNNNQLFYCRVTDGTRCLSYQNFYLSEQIESNNIFFSQGDKVVLYCKAGGNNQHWDTPSGQLNGSDVRSNHMFISTGDRSEHFSLVIHSVSEEHRGEYSCISSSFEMQYSLVICPKKERKEIFVFEAGEVTLQCDIGQEDSNKVHWYRREPSGQQEPIFDSDDETVPIPEDLRGRLAVSGNGATLTLSRVVRTDEREYWCVVLKFSGFLGGKDYTYYYQGEEGEEEGEEEEGEGEEGEEEEQEEEEEEEESSGWFEDRCLFKQVTFLSVNNRSRNFKESDPVPAQKATPAEREPPSGGGSATGFRVGALLVVTAIVAVVVL